MKHSGGKRYNGKIRLGPIRPGAVALILVLLLGVCAVPAVGWFFYGRRVAAVAEIDSPNSIYISAGMGENMVNLDLSDINVEGGKTLPGNENMKYQDFVFSVRGEYINNYKLQLAYTTNNQFTYDIYKATTEGANPSHYDVRYDSREQPGTTAFYLTTGNPLGGGFLNQGASGTLAQPTGTYHDVTYVREDGLGTYGQVNKYAEPLYWQSDAVEVPQERRTSFLDCYIIRVKWPQEKKNDRETDIIYISASVVTTAG